MYAVLLCAALVLFPNAALRGAGLGLKICLDSVIISLLPFMVVSSVLVESGRGEKFGRLLSPILRPLLGLDAVCSMCFVTGLLGGYPCGARCVAQSVDTGLMSRHDGERALAFCNNSGPLFIIGTAGVSVYGSVKIGMLLYCCHVFGAIVSALCFGRSGKMQSLPPSQAIKRSPFALAAKAAKDGGSAIIGVCALVITFSALIEALSLYRLPALVGLFEVSRGVSELGRYGVSALPLAAAYLSWGGLSVHLQTEAVAEGLSKKYYYAGKTISALASGAAMLVCIKFFGGSII